MVPSTCRRERINPKNSTQQGSVKLVFCRFVHIVVDIVSTGICSSPVLLIFVVTLHSTALLHEVYNDMGKLRLE